MKRVEISNYYLILAGGTSLNSFLTLPFLPFFALEVDSLSALFFVAAFLLCGCLRLNSGTVGFSAGFFQASINANPFPDSLFFSA